MKLKFSLLIALAAGLVAGCAAYYSVFGLSQLFAGAGMAVIIMASSLEFSKVVAVSFLQRYWNNISRALKIYLCIGVLTLVCITSAGIYGFLSNAYQKTAHKLEMSESQISVLNNKKELFQKNINDNNSIILTKSNRVDQLTNLRSNQETRLDNANNNSNRNRARNDISSSNQEIQKLNGEIDVLNNKNVSLTDSVNFYSNKILELKTKDNTSAEIGPLKYLAQLTGQPMDKVVNWFILLLIFVFDPLAVALVIATNRVMQIEKGNQEPVIDEPKEKKKWFKNLTSFVKKKYNTIVDEINKPKIEQPKIIEEIPEPEIVPQKQKIEIQVEEEKPKEKIDPVNEEFQKINEDIKKTNRGFSVNIPSPSNMIQRVGSNKIIKNNDDSILFFKKKKK
jgi:hypothetical protein